MRANKLLLVALILIAAAAAPLLPGAAGAAPQPVFLRVVPTGFVVPANGVLGTDAVWVVDPVETPVLNDLDGVAGCLIDVPDADANGRFDGGEVLDAATAAGCISGWDYEEFPCCGRFVTMVDGLEQQGWPVSFWFLQIDGHGSSVGIDDMNLLHHQSLELVYYLGPL